MSIRGRRLFAEIRYCTIKTSPMGISSLNIILVLILHHCLTAQLHSVLTWCMHCEVGNLPLSSCSLEWSHPLLNGEKLSASCKDGCMVTVKNLPFVLLVFFHEVNLYNYGSEVCTLSMENVIRGRRCSKYILKMMSSNTADIPCGN